MSGLVIVLRGVSGAGKSTYAARLATESRAGARVAVVSADDFFVQDGAYKFAPERLSEAHGACFRSFMANITLEVERVIVDNTNISAAEIAPYMLAASAYGYEAEIHQVQCAPSEAALRGVHGVRPERVAQMARSIVSETLPPWWTTKFVDNMVRTAAYEREGG